MSDKCKMNMFQEFIPQIHLKRVYILYKMEGWDGDE